MAPKRREARFRVILSYVILGAWGASFILDAAFKGYDFPPTVHGLMMAVVAYYFYPGKDKPNDPPTG